MPTESSSRTLLANWLPALLLVAVALGQIYRAFTTDLVIGKGGGFGMFAVADGRGQRTWSADCLTPEREPCRIFLARKGGRLGRLSPATDALPRPSVHEAVADYLINARYVRVELNELAEARNIPRKMLTRLPEETRRTPIYRLARANEESVSLPAIRLRYWRLRFDGEAVQYQVESMPGTQERGEW